MTRSQWSSGDHHGLALPGMLALLSGDVSSDDAVSIWEELESTEVLEGLGSLLDVLSEVTGRGLRSLPDFAMAVLDEHGLHVAVRGTFSSETTQSDGSVVTMHGSEVSTWAERNFDAASADALVLSSAAHGDRWLPIAGGIVPAGAVRLVLVPGSTPTPAPAPAASVAAPQVTPEPEVVPEPEPVASEPEVLARPETLIEPVEQVEPVEAVEPEPEVQLEPEPAEPEPVVPSRFASLLSPHTVMHDIEDAAVRPDETVMPGSPAAIPAGAVADEPVVADPVVIEPASIAPATPAPQPAPITSSSFISAVPSTPTTPRASAPTLAPATYEPAEAEDLEHHDGHTQFELPDEGDLDGYLDQPVAADQSETVLGVLCASGHANPTHRTVCRVCSQLLAGSGTRMPRPSLGWLHTSSGESIELVQNVLAGRDPRASRIQGPVMPRLLPLPHSHVSGTHLEIRLEGWSVLVADLRSTNGTFLQRPGQPTLRISEAPQLLMSEDVIQLGHGVDLRFEALP